MKKFISICLLAIMCLFMTDTLSGLRAEAAVKAEQSGVEISISSDRDEYAAAEDAQIGFTIRNTNDADLEGVNWALQLPDGLAAKSGSLSGENLRLRAGESYEGSVSVEVASPDTTEAVTETSGTTTSAETTTTAAPSVNAGEHKSAIGIFGIIAAAAALMWITRKRSRKLFGVLSVFFCAGLVAFSAPVRIFAADEESISVEAEKTLKFDGTEYTVKLSVTADAPQEAAEPSDFYAWAEYSKENNAVTVKWQAQENASGYKVYDKAAPETPLAEVKDGTEYVFAISGSDTKAKYVFFVEAETADGEKAVSNDVTLRRNSDGSYTFSDIDSDRDGLDDLEEISRKTDRLNPDTDGDGLKDGYEVNQASTDPLSADTDENGTPDGAEDFDGDGIPTGQESQHRANPYSGDTDEDGFPDSYEIMNGMNPATADPITIDEEKASVVKDYTLTDIEALNENEEYPLEVFYNDDKFIERINGIYTTDRIQNAQDALYSLYHIKSLLGMNDPAAELVFTKTVMSQWSVAYSFNQVYQGVEAEGRTVTVTCKKDGKISSIFSGYLNADHFKNLNLKPTVTKQQLRKIVSSGSDKPADIFSSDLCIRMNPEPVLVYRVVTGLKTVWIDAHTGKTVNETSHLTAYVGGMVQVQAKDESGKNRSIDVFDETSDGVNDTFRLYHDTKKIAVYVGSEIRSAYFTSTGKPDIIVDGGYSSHHQCTTRQTSSFLAPAVDSWDSNAVSSYYNILQVRDRFAGKQYYGLNGSGGATPVIVRFDDIFLLLGGDKDGDGVLDHSNAGYYVGPYSYNYYEHIMITEAHGTAHSIGNELSLIGHEFGHGVVAHRKAQNATLSTKFLGTANEAYADIFGSWVANKWMANPAPLRNIVIPGNSGNPAVIGDSNYDPNFADVHHNSTIISHAAYLLDTKYGYTMDDVCDVFYESLKDLSDSVTSFDQIRNNVVAAARTIGYPGEKVNQIYKAFEDVGVTWPKSSAKIVVREGTEYVKYATVAISNGDTNKTGSTGKTGEVVFDDLLVGSHEVMVSVLAGPTIRTTILVNENEQTECVIDLLAASTNYDWDLYDHYNFQQAIGPTLEQHIEFNRKDIKMRGYTEVPFKDFLLTHENDDPDSFVHGAAKILSFSIERDQADWHTLEGGGFLFDVSITPPAEGTGDAEESGAEDGETEGSEAGSEDEIVPGSEGFLTAHCVLVTRDGLKIYYLEDVDIALFRNGKLGRIDYIGQKLGDYSYDIGDVCAHHSISINIRKGATETISILDSSNVVVENLEVDKLDGDDYGPITSHDDHWCDQESWFTFSNIAMSNVS